MFAAMLPSAEACLTTSAKPDASPWVMAGVRTAVNWGQAPPLRYIWMDWVSWEPLMVTSGSEVFSGDSLAAAMRSRICCTPCSTPPVSGQVSPVWPSRQAWT